MSNCKIICLDPDNGLEIKSVSSKANIKAGKYAFYDEVMELYSNKEACVIYQHLNRMSSHKNQMIQKAQKLKGLIAESDTVFAVRFSPYSARAYFVLTQKSLYKTIKQRLTVYLNSDCGQFWDNYLEISS